MKKIFSFLTAILFAGSMMAAVTSTFSKATAPADSKVTDLEGVVTWNIATVVGAGEPTIATGSSYSLECLKFGSSSKQYFSKVTLSTDYFKDKNVTAVKVNVINNGKKTSTFTAKQGEVTIGSVSKEFSNPWEELSASGSKGAGGTLEIIYEVEQAFNLNFIEVTFEDGESGGGEEAKSQKLYLEPTSEWNKDGAQFGIYAFEDGKDPYFSDFMASVVGDAEIFVGTIPEGYTNVVFIRLKDDATEVNFDNKWNQSVDLKLDGENDMFTITGWVEEEGLDKGKAKGDWSKYAKPVLTDGFYLIGQKGWDVAALSSDLLFAAFDETQFKLTADLVEGQEIKVVEVKRDKLIKWYPDGEGTHYTVDADHVGEKKDIYFRPDGLGGEDWHYGYFWTGIDTDVHVKSTFVYATTEEKDAAADELAKNQITDNGGITWTIATVVGKGEPAITTAYSKDKDPEGYLKLGSNKSNYFNKVTFSTDYFKAKKVTAVKIYVYNNGKVTGNLTAKQGEITIGTAKNVEVSTWVAITAKTDMVVGAGGNLEVSYEIEEEDGRSYNLAYIEVSYEKGGTTAIDNAEESVKAVKTIENGMLIIEKAGVRYNVMGQIIR